MNKLNKTCCFIGHRKIDWTDELEEKVKQIVEDLIVNQNVQTFLFGSRSEFDALCNYVVGLLKEKYPNIKLINFLCKNETSILDCDETQIIETFGRSSYIQRNKAMIDESGLCIFFFDEKLHKTKSGTRIAYEYAKNKTKKIINVFSAILKFKI